MTKISPLYRFMSFSSQQYHISRLCNVSNKTYRQFSIRYNMQSRLSIDILYQLTQYRQSILRIRIIISSHNHISKTIDYRSHLWSFCFISISWRSKQHNKSLLGNSTQVAQCFIKRIRRMCKIDIVVASIMYHFFQSSWHSRESLQRLYRLPHIHTHLNTHTERSKDILDIKHSQKIRF